MTSGVVNQAQLRCGSHRQSGADLFADFAASGMIIDTNSGLISWTPAMTGTFPVTVVATNSQGTDTQTFDLTVSDVSTCSGEFSIYWQLDETSGTSFVDLIGNNDATFVGGGTPIFATGQVNGALDFDGADDRLSAPINGSGQPIHNNGLGQPGCDWWSK
ncbi:Ig domain-containing protein [Chloroflexi bacterium TSY]|nr:Ig domain-containing protein [Chloroflexi bacterium TSY]